MRKWTAALLEKPHQGWTEKHLRQPESQYKVPVALALPPSSIPTQTAHSQEKRTTTVLGLEMAGSQVAPEVLQSLEEMKMMLGQLHLAAKEGLRPATPPQVPWDARSEPSCRGFQPPGGEKLQRPSVGRVVVKLHVWSVQRQFQQC